MKRICFTILLAAITWGIVFAGELDVTGEWIVGSDDVGGSGITADFNVKTFVDEPVAVSTIERQTEERPKFEAMQSVFNDPDRPDVRIRAMNEQWNNPPAYTQSVSTKYTFTIIPVGAVFEFAANGSTLTGSILRGNREQQIYEGKINGKKITFTVREVLEEKTYSYSYSGELFEDSIRFDVTPPRGVGERFQFRVRRPE